MSEEIAETIKRMKMPPVSEPFCSPIIQAYWYCPRRHGEGDFENFGDRIAEKIISYYTGKKIVWRDPNDIHWYSRNKRLYLTVGSVAKRSNRHCVVWGSGIKEKNFIPKGVKKICCVRGPLTRKFLLNHGFDVPEIYGDPALLLPKIYETSLDVHDIFGVIPHYVDFETAVELFKDEPRIRVIDLRDSVDKVISSIATCKATISSSLHGIIVSHAFGIPCVRVEFSDKISGDGIKYDDYFESVGILPYRPQRVATNDQFSACRFFDRLFSRGETCHLPNSAIIEQRQSDLLGSMPFI